MADIIYTWDGNPYFNITNDCPCRCAFCIRDKQAVVGEAGAMWHDVQPTFREVKAAIDGFNWNSCTEAVFCGYGEPTAQLSLLLETARYMKALHPQISLRINTNGLSDLINGRSTAKEICENIDVISVSLNEASSEKFDRLTRNIYPGRAYPAMLQFTRDCVALGRRVAMTAVDVIPPEEVTQCRAICESTGAAFRLRSFDRGR